ncbi:unnamed protein product [Protopolystoma xenopodis]|uniref:Uncharacterized protein n=1 Tax=Protopolystoma xenopodis TaxID=117903 RepID=A0A448XIC9_9PLAT|nr:unnamed protein product [Protopolystoma xenopodis]
MASQATYFTAHPPNRMARTEELKHHGSDHDVHLKGSGSWSPDYSTRTTLSCLRRPTVATIVDPGGQIWQQGFRGRDDGSKTANYESRL